MAHLQHARNHTKTSSQVLPESPSVHIRAPHPDGYADNIDALKFATTTSATTFDFEPSIAPPANKDVRKQDGGRAFNDPTFKDQGDSIPSVNTGE